MTVLAEGAPRSRGRTTRCRVTYAVSQWGAVTETFVRREALATREAGAEVHVLSLKRPVPDGTGLPVTWVHPFGVVRDLVRTVLHAPRATWGVLVEVVRGSRLATLGRRVAAAAIGLAWAQRPEARADLVHVHFGWVAATAAWAASRITRRPYSIVLHAFDVHADRRVDRFSVVPLHDAVRVFTVSERDRDVVSARWAVDADVLRMGVTDDWLHDPPLATSEREPWLVVSVGSLVPKKGHDVLLAALARTRHPWRLEIVGEGPQRAGLEERIGVLGLGERAVLVGALAEADVRDRLRRAAACCLACVVAPDGDRDGIPVALMEAMACGTPVLSTLVGGIPELVEGAGALVPPGDPDALASALDALADPALRDELGRRGRARVAESFRVAPAGSVVVGVATS